MLKRVLSMGAVMLLMTLSTYAIKIPQEKKPPAPELYTKVWEKHYGGRDNDIAHDVVALEEGKSAIVGSCRSFSQSSQACVIGVDSSGEVQWRLLLGGEKFDEGRAIVQSNDGYLFVLGTTKSLAKEYDKDIYLAKITKEGKLLWERALGGVRDEEAGGLVATDDGGVFVVGDTNSFGDIYGDIYMARITKDGGVRFALTTGGKKRDSARDITLLSDGNFAIAGVRDSRERNYEEFFVMKITPMGKVVWSKTFGGIDDDSLESIVGTHDGGMVAVGKSRSYGSSQTDLSVMKLSSSGQTLWHKIYGFKYYEYGNAVTLLDNGDLIFVGGTNTLGKGSHSLYAMALSSAGEVLWSQIYGGEDRDVGYGVTQLSDKSILIVGQSESLSRTKDIYMIKVQEDKAVAKGIRDAQ
jgi:hypothetical protein